jgi:glucose-6-phosphate-specific signal transduction histidine kinase
MAKSIGYSLTARGAKDVTPGDKLQEKFDAIQESVKTLQENYYSYRNDETRQPHQKIGQAMSELNRQLKLVERALKMNSRLKKESGLSNDNLWKRTATQMVKLEGKLTELAARLRDMRN